MCEGLYGDTSVASKVRCAYICDVDYTMTINYLGEKETEDDKMSLICYKKGGKWYPDRLFYLTKILSVTVLDSPGASSV